LAFYDDLEAVQQIMITSVKSREAFFEEGKDSLLPI